MFWCSIASPSHQRASAELNMFLMISDNFPASVELSTHKRSLFHSRKNEENGFFMHVSIVISGWEIVDRGESVLAVDIHSRF